jgi:hypothetical protein
MRVSETSTAASGQGNWLRKKEAGINALAHHADIAKVQEWLGHANIATTRLYDRRQSRPEESPRGTHAHGQRALRSMVRTETGEEKQEHCGSHIYAEDNKENPEQSAQGSVLFDLTSFQAC